MHLGIDIREACKQERTGKGQWTYGFVSELLNRDIPLTFFTDADIPSGWSDRIKRRNVIVVAPASRGARWHWEVRQCVSRSTDIDVYVSTVSYIVPFLLGTKKRCIPIVHDLIAFSHEPHDRKATIIERATLARAVRSAAHICTVSETTKRDLLAKFPSLQAAKITPVFAGSNAKAALHSHSDQKSILCIGTLCPRKNQLRLIQAFNALPENVRCDCRLILVGKRGWQDDDIVALANSSSRVEWLGFQTDEACERLLASATLLAFPSLYEGFGIPILDAFSKGVPVLTSSIGSMKEVAGDSAMLVDPLNVDEIKNGLQTLLADEALRTRLSLAGKKRADDFSWERTVDVFLDAVSGIS